ncbi:hypothetical protein Glo7428_4562 [Gloeocapsa sp. PCC 7428]|nr:hypothetical protein Glo7428_4562 [Gloeocapsa sp. PCC 7428]
MPTRKVFLDTSYLLTLELANDQNHQAAQAHWQQVVTNVNAFITTSYIFYEVVTYFNSRNHHAKVVQVGNYLLLSPSVQLVHVDETLFYLGWAYFQQHKDKKYSLTDSISFIIMQQYDIYSVYAIDNSECLKSSERKAIIICSFEMPALIKSAAIPFSVPSRCIQN